MNSRMVIAAERRSSRQGDEESAMRAWKRNDEQGAVVVIVALVAVVLFAAAAYAIDAGNLWQTRRNMVTATDASALAAASQYALGEDGCASAIQWLADNRADATIDACDPSGSTEAGYVTVGGHTVVPFSFAGIFGMKNQSVKSATTAKWGVPSGALGLRPIALCLSSTPGLEQWLNLPNGPTGPTTTPLTITLSNAQPDACKDSTGTAVGNWGLAFGSGNNANSDTVNWLNNGFPNQVNIGSDIVANPGAFSGSLQSALQTLADNNTWFALPVFDRVDNAGGNGGGSNATYHVVAFVFVQLVAFNVSGNQAARYITVNLNLGVIQGTCCSTGPDSGTRVVQICDVDTLNPNTGTNAC
jgi:Flp pilus assembly protein TadG